MKQGLTTSEETDSLPIIVTAGEDVGEVVHRAHPGPDVQQVDGGGTHGEEGDVYPSSNLQTEHLSLSRLHNLHSQYYWPHCQGGTHKPAQFYSRRSKIDNDNFRSLQPL